MTASSGSAEPSAATDISDDSFDYSSGYQGLGQFWLAQQDPDDADNGFEVGDGTVRQYEADGLRRGAAGLTGRDNAETVDRANAGLFGVVFSNVSKILSGLRWGES